MKRKASPLVPQTIVIRPDARLFERIDAARELMREETGARPSLAAVCRVLLVRGLHNYDKARR